MSEEIREQAINLILKRNVKTLIIDGVKFTMDLDDPEVYKALMEFKEIHNHPASIEDDVDALLEDCRDVIDTVLGDGTCDRMFAQMDMKMYLLVNELARVYMENFMKEEREQAEAKAKKELEGIKEIINGMSEFAKMANYANEKYRKQGMRNYVRNKRSSKKNRGKKH